MLWAGGLGFGVAENRTDGQSADRTEGGIGLYVRWAVGVAGVTVHIREVEGSSPFSPTKIIRRQPSSQITLGRRLSAFPGMALLSVEDLP